MLRIVQTLPQLEKAGAERFVVDLSNALAENIQNEVILISLFDNEEDTSFLGEVSQKVRYISLGKKKGFDATIFLKLFKVLKSLGPNVIHTHLGALEYAIPYILTHKCKSIHTIHSLADRECPKTPLNIVRRIRRYLFKQQCSAVSIAQETALSYTQFYHLNSPVLIENGRPELSVDSQQVAIISKEYRTDSNDLLFVNIARINKLKNQELLVDVFNALYDEGLFKARLLVIGKVDDEALLVELKRKIKHNTVTFMGPKANVSDYLAAADGFCLSSVYEGMPISLIEALSLGCVPIATAVGGILDMINEGENGFLSSDLSLTSYKEAMYRFLYAHQQGQLKTIQEKGIQAYQSKYHMNICFKKYMHLYES